MEREAALSRLMIHIQQVESACTKRVPLKKGCSSALARFTVNFKLNSQKNRYYCSESLHSVHEVPLNDIMLESGV